MVTYPFPPSPEGLSFGDHPYAFWNEAFSDEDIVLIEAMFADAEGKPATIGDGEYKKDFRNSEVRWISPDTGWLSERLSHIARQINGEYFGFDLWGFGEHFQHSTYTEPVLHKGKTMSIGLAEDAGQFGWHMDMGSVDMNRKLSLVLLLNDDFEGGELQIMTGENIDTCDLIKGRVIAFPAYHLHRVTPVTKGERRTMVVWVSGPRFR